MQDLLHIAFKMKRFASNNGKVYFFCLFGKA